MKSDQTGYHPCGYRIEVHGELDRKWEDWFHGFIILPQERGATILEGTVQDQAALHGLLAKIRDLGLPLIRVERMEGPVTE